ncbi:MAG TPA: exodeoxyribonuclease VII small subunit [Rudaea sp.]|nr:exodeoxyribonuclease VII small subunit [Rudaea sp.]
MPQSDAKPTAPAESLTAAPSDSSQIADFEKSLDELERLVARMEQGDQSLDESLRSFERGVALYRNCQGALEQAELRVKLLLDPHAPDAAEPFEPDTP